MSKLLLPSLRAFLALAAILPALPGRAAEPPDLGTRKAGVDWPRFLGPTGDSKSSERGIATKWTDDGPRLLWHVKAGWGYAAPAISRGRLFLFEADRRQVRLRCLNSETGKSVWDSDFSFPNDYHDTFGIADNGPRSSPIVDDDRVYCIGPDGMLYCLSVFDHKVLWALDTTDKFHVVQNFFGVGSTPVIEGDLLILPIGGSPAGSHPNGGPDQLGPIKGAGSGIVALDKLTGTVKYQVTDELASYASPTLATINGRRWGFVFARGSLIGFDPATGKVDFEFPWRSKKLYSVNAATPVVVGDTVFISESYGPGSALLRVKPGGYDVVWKDPEGLRDPKAMALHWNTPIAIDGYIYGSSGENEDAELRCLELATGKVKWSQPDLGRSSLLYVDGHFICLSESGRVLLLRANPEKYDVVASCLPKNPDLPADADSRQMLGIPAWTAPVLSHGLLYLRGRDQLVCYELIPTK